MSKELSDSKLFIFFDRTFVNFDRYLARAHGNVLECTTCKHACTHKLVDAETKPSP